jgi:predicted methyltransferase MtxX (methanogen marker protein 4)
MEILENLRNDIKALSAKIEQVSKKVEQPPVVKIDTDKLAAAVTRKLDDYTASGESVAKRIEATAARIPTKLRHEYGLNENTRLMLIAMTIMVLVGIGIGYMLAPLFNQKYLDYQNEQLVNAKRAIQKQNAELEFLRTKNPRDAATWDKQQFLR